MRRTDFQLLQPRNDIIVKKEKEKFSARKSDGKAVDKEALRCLL